MKTVILAGGYGTRISEESHLKPKPMIEIGGQPILWHIMKHYSAYGFNDFIICAGYKQHVIKEYFANYYLHRSNLTFDFSNGGAVTEHSSVSEPWRVTIIDTGLNTMTGGRIQRIRDHIGDEPFMLTYGDGVSDVDLHALAAFHRQHGKIGTISAVGVSQRFGILDIEKNTINAFREKNDVDGGRINGGYMVFSPRVFNYIHDDTTVLERGPMETLAQEGQLMAYQHNGFWQCMDTLRDKLYLEELIEKGQAPWLVWDNA